MAKSLCRLLIKENHAIVANFRVAKMSFNAIRENKIIAKISEFTISRACLSYSSLVVYVVAVVGLNVTFNNKTPCLDMLLCELSWHDTSYDQILSVIRFRLRIIRPQKFEVWSLNYFYSLKSSQWHYRYSILKVLKAISQTENWNRHDIVCV